MTNRSPEPVEGRFTDKRPSTGSGLRLCIGSAFFLVVGASSGTVVEKPVQAQAWQCIAPASLPRPGPEYPKAGESRRTPVARYILALSWSREHCKGRENAPGQNLQCDGRIGEFGFIVHGLWPEASGPDYPQWCRKAEPLSRKVITENICMTPDVQLLQHEWAKHGTCMARKPETYFGAARLLFDAMTFPDMDRLSRQGVKEGKPLTVAGLADAFASNNEGLPRDALRVKTNRKGWLEEVRVCLNKKFKPIRCPAFVKGAPPSSEVKIWRGR